MRKKYLLLLVLSMVVVLALPFLPAPSGAATGWATFFGRFHILILHFPVVLVLALAGLEGWRLFRKEDSQGILLSVAWIATLLSCFATILAGYFLYLTGEYEGKLVRSHLWGGVLLMCTLAAAAFFHFQPPIHLSSRGRLFSPILLGLAAVLAIYTGHLGGSLTHGAGFLTEYLPELRISKAAPVENKKPEELLVYADVIFPIFENRCLSCHNKYKTKGGLLMTSFPELAKGGKSAKPMLVEGQPEKSELYHRITLPAGDEDRMPPPEKPGLTDDELTLIRWWIASGASPEQMLGEGPPGVEGQALIDRYLPQLYRSQRLKMRQQQETAALAIELRKVGEKLDLIIEPDSTSEGGYFAISMPIPPPVVDDQTIARLLPYAEIFSRISLPGAGITDEGLYHFGRMPHLRQLYLPKSCIKGEGLPYLQSLAELKELNLSYSWLTNEGALHLLKLPQLEKIYVFGTEAESNVLRAMGQHLPEVQILEEEGPYY